MFRTFIRAVKNSISFVVNTMLQFENTKNYLPFFVFILRLLLQNFTHSSHIIVSFGNL
jgi:hypothetical protein